MSIWPTLIHSSNEMGKTMSDAVTHECAAPRHRHSAIRLRAQIGWICHRLRIAVVVWLGWMVVMAIVVWSDRANVLEL